MARPAADIAALKILLITLYGHVAEKEGSAAGANAFIKNTKTSCLDNITKLKSSFPVESHAQIDEVASIVSELLDGIDFQSKVPT